MFLSEPIYIYQVVFGLPEGIDVIILN